jgi:hypothetical protein
VGHKHRHLQVVRHRGELERLLDIIEELAILYPEIEAWSRIRSSDVAGGAGGVGHVPINLAAIDLLEHSYWVAEVPPDEQTEADGDNYRAGIKLTILGRHNELRPPPIYGLEDSIRQLFGLGPVTRYRPATARDGLGIKPGTDQHQAAEDPRVLDALAWFRVVATTLVDDHPGWAMLLRDELGRLAARCHGLMYGVRFHATYSTCAHCFTAGSVISDGQVACCLNPDCRDAAGERRGWRLDGAAGEWVETTWPDVPFRGGRPAAA